MRARGASKDIEGPRYARYISGRDYHDELAEKMERLMEGVAAEAQLSEPLRWKVCVDTSAVLERSWAVLAGLGWIGKNTMLIHPKLGSYFFLGAVLFNQPTRVAPAPMADLCGGCRRCLDACPTGAFTAPKILDSRRCISYWTLENRAPALPPAETRSAYGTWVAGCDLCQEACPFNLKPARRHAEAMGSDQLGGDAPALMHWVELLRETEAEYRERIRNSSLARVKPAQFSRNLALALVNALEATKPEERREFAFLAELLRERARTEAVAETRAAWEECLALIPEARAVN
jgi:epoxyqueuosine reductase